MVGFSPDNGFGQEYPARPIRILVPGYAFDPWFGLLTRAKTPRPVLDKLSREIARIVELPDVREKMRALGAEAAPTTPEAFDAHVRSEVAKFEKIVRAAGIKPE